MNNKKGNTSGTPKAGKEKVTPVWDKNIDDENRLYMPSLLDLEIIKAIHSYRKSEKNRSYASLATELGEYVRDLYSNMSEYIKVKGIDLSVLEKHISDQIPSETYIRDFCNGRSICFRYTNTLANFLGVKYEIRNYNPAKDFENHTTINS